MANPTRSRPWARIATGALMVLVSALGVWGFVIDRAPPMADPVTATTALATARNEQVVTGYATTATLMHLANALLDKRGGYLSNDVLPPGVLMDNQPNWEFGVLQQIRDLSRALRNDFARSQTQSVEDADLAIAEPQFNVSNDSWAFPSAEGEYRKGSAALERYLGRLTDANEADAQFFARADNLRRYLEQVEKRLGSLSEQLNGSVARVKTNTDLANDPNATQSTPTPSTAIKRTPWLQIDDVFYEARGTTWALAQILRAIEIDFAPVLENKNARVSLEQIIRELDAAQRPLGSPIVLNGSGFGLFANHSLVMGNYIARANAGIIDLRQLLEQG
jgi:hypothetical protein